MKIKLTIWNWEMKRENRGRGGHLITSLSGRVPIVEVSDKDRATYCRERYSKHIMFRRYVMSLFKRRSKGG